MAQRRTPGREAIFLVAALLTACLVSAQSPSPDISVEPVPGQLDVMQGTAVQLGGAAPSDGPRPLSYTWEIVQGVDGVLYNDDEAEAIFQAPIIGSDVEVFVVRLTVEYPGGERASNSVHLRVHRDDPNMEPATTEESIEDVMAEYYRREEEVRERNRRTSETETVIIDHGFRGYHGGIGYAGPGWGWGYGWGWPARYPVYAPVVVPPPGIHWSPGVGTWENPVAIPYDDLISTFPDHISNDYGPQDYPGDRATTGSEGSGAIDTDFIVIPPGAKNKPEDDSFVVETGSGSGDLDRD